jgi:type I restriction enzyme, R subunit
MQPALVYESPFTNISPQGPETLFGTGQVDDLITILEQVRATALAS